MWPGRCWERCCWEFREWVEAAARGQDFVANEVDDDKLGLRATLGDDGETPTTWESGEVLFDEEDDADEADLPPPMLLLDVWRE